MKRARVQRFVDGLAESGRQIDTANKLMVHVTDPAFQSMTPREELSGMAEEASHLRINASGLLRTAARDLRGKARHLAGPLRAMADSQVLRSHSEANLAVSFATVKVNRRQ